MQHRRVPRPVSDPMKTVADKMADLEKRLRQLETGATSSGAVVRSKAMLVKGGAAMEVQDADGQVRFYVGKLVDQPDEAGVAVYDKAGRVIVGDDVSGQGLAQPWLNTPVYPTKSGAYQSTTSGTFETLWDGIHSKLHPRLHVGVWIRVDADTAGEVRVTADGVTVGTVTAPTGSWADYEVGPTEIAGEHTASVLVEIRARRTSGTGSISVVPAFVRGEQT